MTEVKKKSKANPTKEKDERAARNQILEDLFYDFNSSKGQVYRVNFFRGIFFGLGTVLGGTVLVALMIWSLGQFAQWFPTVSVPVNIITNSLQK